MLARLLSVHFPASLGRGLLGESTSGQWSGHKALGDDTMMQVAHQENAVSFGDLTCLLPWIRNANHGRL